MDLTKITSRLFRCLAGVLLISNVFTYGQESWTIEGNTFAENEVSARLHRIEVLWDTLQSQPQDAETRAFWSAHEVLSFVAAAHKGHEYVFEDAQVRQVVGTRDGVFNVDASGFSDAQAVVRAQTRAIFQDASLFFHSMLQNKSIYGPFVFPNNVSEADRFFSMALMGEMQVEEGTMDFGFNDLHQEFAISGLHDPIEIETGRVSENSVRNHALVQAVLCAARALIAYGEIPNWSGPGEDDFDKVSLVGDYGSMVPGDEEGENRFIEVSLYWAMRALIQYNRSREFSYDETDGSMEIATAADVIVAHCFAAIHEAYLSRGVLDLTDRFFAGLQGRTDGTRLEGWLDFSQIDLNPTRTDAAALDYLYARLPGGYNGAKRDLLNVLEAVDGATSMITVSHYWAHLYTHHPDYKTFKQTEDEIKLVDEAIRQAQQDRGRPGGESDTWSYQSRESSLERLGEERFRDRSIKAAVIIGAVFLTIATEGADLSLSGAGAQSWQAFMFALRTGALSEAVIHLQKFGMTMFLDYSLSRLTMTRIGVAISASSLTLLIDPVAIGNPDVDLEVPDPNTSSTVTLSLKEYFEAVAMALRLLAVYDNNDANAVLAAQLLSDYVTGQDVDLRHVELILSLLPESIGAQVGAAFAGTGDDGTLPEAIQVSLHSGDLDTVVTFLFGLGKGGRWPLLERIYEVYGENLGVDLLASMVDRSADETAAILMEYQRSTLLDGNNEAVESPILQLFLGLGIRYSGGDHQERIINACDSLALCGDFLYDIGVWTGTLPAYNESGVAEAINGLTAFKVGKLLTEIYDLTQDRGGPEGLSDAVAVELLGDNEGVVDGVVYYTIATDQVTFGGSGSNVTKVNQTLTDASLFMDWTQDWYQFAGGGGGDGPDDGGGGGFFLPSSHMSRMGTSFLEDIIQMLNIAQLQESSWDYWANLFFRVGEDTMAATFKKMVEFGQQYEALAKLLYYAYQNMLDGVPGFSDPANWLDQISLKSRAILINETITLFPISGINLSILDEAVGFIAEQIHALDNSFSQAVVEEVATEIQAVTSNYGPSWWLRVLQGSIETGGITPTGFSRFIGIVRTYNILDIQSLGWILDNLSSDYPNFVAQVNQDGEFPPSYLASLPAEELARILETLTPQEVASFQSTIPLGTFISALLLVNAEHAGAIISELPDDRILELFLLIETDDLGRILQTMFPERIGEMISYLHGEQHLTKIVDILLSDSISAMFAAAILVDVAEDKRIEILDGIGDQGEAIQDYINIASFLTASEARDELLEMDPQEAGSFLLVMPEALVNEILGIMQADAAARILSTLNPDLVRDLLQNFLSSDSDSSNGDAIDGVNRVLDILSNMDPAIARTIIMSDNGSELDFEISDDMRLNEDERELRISYLSSSLEPIISLMQTSAASAFIYHDMFARLAARILSNLDLAEAVEIIILGESDKTSIYLAIIEPKITAKILLALDPERAHLIMENMSESAIAQILGTFEVREKISRVMEILSAQSDSRLAHIVSEMDAQAAEDLFSLMISSGYVDEVASIVSLMSPSRAVRVLGFSVNYVAMLFSNPNLSITSTALIAKLMDQVVREEIFSKMEESRVNEIRERMGFFENADLEDEVIIDLLNSQSLETGINILLSLSPEQASRILTLLVLNDEVDTAANFLATMMPQDAGQLLQYIAEHNSFDSAKEIILAMGPQKAGLILIAMETGLAGRFLTALGSEAAEEILAYASPESDIVLGNTPSETDTLIVQIFLTMDFTYVGRILLVINPSDPIEARLLAGIIAAMEPEDVGRILVTMEPEDAVRILVDRNSESTANILATMTPEAAGRILAIMDTEVAGQILVDMEPLDAAVNIFAAMDPAAAGRILAIIEPEVAEQILAIMESANAANILLTMELEQTAEIVRLMRSDVKSAILEAIRRRDGDYYFELMAILVSNPDEDGSDEDDQRHLQVHPEVPENILIVSTWAASSDDSSDQQASDFQSPNALQISWSAVSPISDEHEHLVDDEKEDDWTILYHVYRTRTIESEPTDEDWIGQTVDLEYIDLLVEPNQLYYYWLVGDNGYNLSAFSDPVAGILAAERPDEDGSDDPAGGGANDPGLSYSALAGVNASRAIGVIGQLFNGETGGQAGYLGGDHALSKYGRVWVYDQGISLSLAVNGGVGGSGQRAQWLVDNARYDENGVFIGWPFSINERDDAWEDARRVTGANAWAMHGLAEYVAKGGGGGGYQELFAQGLSGAILPNRLGNGLFAAGLSPIGLNNPGAFGLTYNELLGVMGDYLQILKRESALLAAFDTAIDTVLGPVLSLTEIDELIKGLFEKLAEDVGFVLEAFDMQLERKSHVVTEHCIDVLDLLNYTLDNYGALNPDQSYGELDGIRRSLRDAIFSNLYRDGHFVTGNGSSLVAIDNSTWLCSALRRDELSSGQVDQLASGLNYTIATFVKPIVVGGGVYWGAHYFTNDFHDRYITQGGDQEAAFHIEATTGLIVALNDFADSFPNHENTEYFRHTATYLWREIQLFINHFGLPYSSVDIQDLFATFECSVSSIWFLQTHRYYQAHPEYYDLPEGFEIFPGFFDQDELPSDNGGSDSENEAGTSDPSKDALTLVDYENTSEYEHVGTYGEGTGQVKVDSSGNSVGSFIDDDTGFGLIEIYQLHNQLNIEDYQELVFDFLSYGQDSTRTIEIQLRFENKENAGADNFWNWKQPPTLSSGYGNWTKISIALNPENFERSSRWQQGSEFNLDQLKGLAVLILSNSSSEPSSEIYVDNIRVEELKVADQDSEENIYPESLDMDVDGLDDAWEELYLGSIASYKKLDDPDGDGRSNWVEYLSGSDPSDPQDYFRILDYNIDLGFKSVKLTISSPKDNLVSRNYRILYTDALLGDNWRELSMDIPLSSDVGSETTTMELDLPEGLDTSNLFFKVESYIQAP